MKKAKTGFTLIELLVVIAVIALLLSILTPALRNAKRMAQGTACLSSMRSLGMSWTLYSSENDGKLAGGATYSQYANEPISLDPWSGRASWVVISPELYTRTAGPLFEDYPLTYEEREDTLTKGSLWPYLESVKAYKCAGDRKDYLRSYSIANTMNGQMQVYDNDPYVARRMSEIKSPGSKMVFAEYDDPRVFRYGPWVCYVEIESFVDMVSLWHNDRSNYAFADGHSEPHKWVDDRTIEMVERNAFEESSPGNPDLQWLQRAYRAK